MDSRKRARIERERLVLTDYGAAIMDHKPAKYLTYTLPSRFKTFLQFLDPVNEGYWSVELLIELEKEGAKLLEIIPRGITYKPQIFTDGMNYIYKHPTEAVAGWQIALVKNNLNKLTAHSISLGIAHFTHSGDSNWKLSGKDLSENEFQRVRTDIATKKRQRFTSERAKEVKKVLDRERKKAREAGTKYRGNEVLAEVFGISVKTAESWAARVSTPSGGKKQTKKKGRK